jgi:hypothetical protein
MLLGFSALLVGLDLYFISQGLPARDWELSAVLIAFALFFAVGAVSYWSNQIYIDDSTLIFGSFLWRRRYARGEIARIKLGISADTRWASFVRRDGKEVFSIGRPVRGVATIRSLGDHLGVEVTQRSIRFTCGRSLAKQRFGHPAIDSFRPSSRTACDRPRHQ